MKGSIVVLEKDPRLALSLAGSLRREFSCVQVTTSEEDLRAKIRRDSSGAVVFSIESGRLSDVSILHAEFPLLPIICTHRVPDEDMWMAALGAGATDVCAVNDVRGILDAVLRSVEALKAA